jgi:hypothetical protein
MYSIFTLRRGVVNEEIKESLYEGRCACNEGSKGRYVHDATNTQGIFASQHITFT